MRFRLRPLVTIAPKVSPDPAQAAELARRRAALAYVPSNGFLVEPAAGPRFDPPPISMPESEVVCITDEAAITELLECRCGMDECQCRPLVIPLCTSSPVQAPALQEHEPELGPDLDWSQFDSPAWERRGRPDPMRRSTAALLMPLPALLRRQAG